MAITSYALYNIADALAMQVEWHRKDNTLKGKTDRIVMFGHLPIKLPMKIVGSHVGQSNASVLVDVIGNLHLLVTIETVNKDLGTRLSLSVVDLAKMPMKPKGWLEAAKPGTHEDAVKALGKAVVATFRKTDRNQWLAA